MTAERGANRPSDRRRRCRRAGGLGTCLLTVVGVLATMALAPAAPAGASSYGFSDPTGIAFDGRDIWVTNYTGNSVTELKASTGAWVRTFSAPSRGFDEPDGIVFVDNLEAGPSSVWVTNTMGNSVTELPTAGGASHVVNAASCHFDRPGGITTDGTDLWVTNGANNTVTEIQASDQTCVRTLSGGPYGFDFPNAITYDGSHIWVANQSGNSITEIDDSDGSWVRTFSAPSRGFEVPIAILSVGEDIWVANENHSVSELDTANDSSQVFSGSAYGFACTGGIAYEDGNVWFTNTPGSVTEIDSASGALVRLFSAPSRGFDDPIAAVAAGQNVWVANYNGSSVTEIDASTGTSQTFS